MGIPAFSLKSLAEIVEKFSLDPLFGLKNL